MPGRRLRRWPDRCCSLCQSWAASVDSTEVRPYPGQYVMKRTAVRKADRCAVDQQGSTGPDSAVKRCHDAIDELPGGVWDGCDHAGAIEIIPVRIRPNFEVYDIVRLPLSQDSVCRSLGIGMSVKSISFEDKLYADRSQESIVITLYLMTNLIFHRFRGFPRSRGWDYVFLACGGSEGRAGKTAGESRYFPGQAGAEAGQFGECHQFLWRISL